MHEWQSWRERVKKPDLARLKLLLATLLVCGGVYFAALNYSMIDWEAFGREVPAMVEEQYEVDSGIQYTRDVVELADGASTLAHVLEIDLEIHSPDIFGVLGSRSEAIATRVSELARIRDWQVGINLSQAEGRHGWGSGRYFPLPGDELTMRGFWNQDGEMLSEEDERTGVVCVGGGEVWIQKTRCEPGVEMAGAGRSVLMLDGQVLVENGGERHPRTLVGVGEGWMVWVVVEGRHRDRVGMTLEESWRYLVTLGVSDGLEADGGGSSAMVIRGEVMNRPSNLLGFERPVGVGMGVGRSD